MKGFKKGGKFIPTSSLIRSNKPSKKSHSEIVSKHSPDGFFTQENPRTKQTEKIKLKKIEKLNNDRNEHVLIGKGSDGRPISKIVS